MATFIAPGKRGYQRNNFLIFPKHMFLWRNKEKCQNFLDEKSALSGVVIFYSSGHN